MKYLFTNLDSLKCKIDKCRLAVFLDYDGTLAPIAENPDKANISAKMRNVLKKLSNNKNCILTIISGRNLQNIKRKIRLKNVIYCGNHGIQIDGRKIRCTYPITQTFKNILKPIQTDLNTKFASYPGVLVENKQFSLGVHYRLAKTTDRKSVV